MGKQGAQPPKEDSGQTKVCVSCSGNGWVYIEGTDGTKTCSACKGSGYIAINTI